MPADHGLGGDHHESLLPSGPELASERPEEFVERAELGPGMPALQHSELLPKCQILQQKTLARVKTAGKWAQPKSEELEHA
jgi:hypothetical protein